MKIAIQLSNGAAIEDGVVTNYGTEQCFSCHSGKNPSQKTCPRCKGTRRGPKGGKDGCRNCFNGKVNDFDNMVTCQRCAGTGIAPANRFSHFPGELWQTLNFEVIDGKRPMTFFESYIGTGFYSVTDYGDHWKLTDAELIEKIRNDDKSHQWCKMVDKNNRLSDTVVIRRLNQGYAVESKA